ncbi:hypothetical protein XELAEV_18007522mg [Xenopus laevis]|uniref:Uncharacterized protein n=1 Tax=Xenopus laevis TaxID=8355 RepID=A0A974E1W4_XENLA|nr:hypothetical protein XELAEV_18007522mg [Xenopus laevis]
MHIFDKLGREDLGYWWCWEIYLYNKCYLLILTHNYNCLLKTFPDTATGTVVLSLHSSGKFMVPIFLPVLCPCSLQGPMQSPVLGPMKITLAITDSENLSVITSFSSLKLSTTLTVNQSDNYQFFP